MNKNLEKIRDIKSVINEFYHERNCRGELSECARKSWLCYQQDCDDIKQALERLETLEKENEDLKVFVDAYSNARDELLIKNEKLEKENQELKEEYDKLDNNFHSCYLDYNELKAENEKLMTVIYIAKNIINWKHKIYYWYEHNFITQAEYDLLKEVLE